MIECNCMIPVMNYGSSASYKAEPSPEQVATGVIPLDSLPAAWWNCMWSQTNTAVNQARQELGQLIVELNNVLCNAGICPQDVCTDQLYQSINKIRQTLGNATTAGAVKSSSDPSAVAIDQTTGTMSVNCLGNAASLTTTARTVVGAINELKSTYDQCFTDTGTAISGKAPTAHASSATTYGVGNADCYGHLKISDTYSSDLGCSGMAASQTALFCVYCTLNDAISQATSLGNTAGCALGTAAAGTANTAARSDHVHPKPTCVACAGANGSGTAFGTAATRDVYTLSAVGTLGYDTTANRTKVPDISALACWNGAYQGTSSNLRYYCGGAFGTAAICAATAFRSCTWWPNCMSCGCVAKACCWDNMSLLTHNQGVGWYQFGSTNNTRPIAWWFNASSTSKVADIITTIKCIAASNNAFGCVSETQWFLIPVSGFYYYNCNNNWLRKQILCAYYYCCTSCPNCSNIALAWAYCSGGGFGPQSMYYDHIYQGCTYLCNANICCLHMQQF